MRRDLLDKLYIKSDRHPHMAMFDRAAQFSPFAALVGYDDAIKRKGHLFEDKIELSEETKAILDRHLHRAIAHDLEVIITYYSFDQYVNISGHIKKIDEIAKVIIVDDTAIDIGDIIDIQNEECDLTNI